MSGQKLILILAITLAGWGLLAPRPASADDPLFDSACRSCHSTNEGTLTLPSGETVPLYVDVEALDSSPHSTVSDTPVRCDDCHTPRSRYQYPHEENPAQTQAEFVAAITQNCQKCHYPHRPFHPEESENELPTCANCHGSHQMDVVENVADTMPSACLACHTEQSAEWAADLIAPRPGLNQPAEGYAGSYRCAGCHEDIYLTWRETLHAKLIQDPAVEPAAVVGNFNSNDPDLTFSLDDVAYTIGSRWKQHYLTQQGNEFYILPAQWNVETREWVAYNADNWQQTEWRQNCGSCHMTGLNLDTGGTAEYGVGCESCHGPAAEHAANPTDIKPFAGVDDQVCGACHSRGTSPEGHPFPITYRPGDTLTEHFTFTTADAAVWPNGSAKKNYQQYMDWELGSLMNKAESITCITCHAPHSRPNTAQLVAPLNDVCLQCHNDKRLVISHVPYHDQAAAEREFLCTDCHMPTIATSAVPYDIHNHSFLQPDPQSSIEHGGIDAMPNACNTCHTGMAESPQWAADTTAYAAQVATSVPAAAFGPGPTPTSPPPPTPIGSVGQEPDVEDYQIEGSRWLRNSFYAVAALAVAGLGYGIYRYIKRRRLPDASKD